MKKNMENKVKDMQDKTPASIVCSACARIIIPAARIEAYRERDIGDLITHHKCFASKRDFEKEIR